MIVREAHEMKRAFIKRLRDEYGLGERREGTHVSDLIHCLTKSYWAATEPEPPTSEEIGLWSIGWALEKVLISRVHVDPLELDGIVGTPDFAFEDGTPADLKTTRMAPNGRKGEDGFQMPEGWLRQFKAYRHMLNEELTYLIDEYVNTPNPRGPLPRRPTHTFGVVVVHLIQAELKVWELAFSDEELQENWDWMVDRRDTLERLIEDEVPEPYQHRLFEAECKNCVYALRCGLAASVQALEYGTSRELAQLSFEETT